MARLGTEVENGRVLELKGWLLGTEANCLVAASVAATEK